MRQLMALLILATAGLVPCSAGFAQDGSPAFAAASEAFADGDYLRALAYFEDARDAGVQGPALHYNLGVCHYRLGDYDHAAAEFRLVADRYPAMRALAEYNLGLVRLRQDRQSEARSLFAQAQQHSTDEKISQLAAAMLRRLDAPIEASDAPRPHWVSLVDVNVGNDDNVALLDDWSLPSGRSVESAFTEAFAVISGPLSTRSGPRFDGSLYTVRYNDAGEFDQTSVHLGGGYGWATGAWRIEAGPNFNHATLDDDSFEQRLGLDLKLQRALSSRTMLALRAGHDEIEGGESQFDYLEGSREQIGVSFDRYGQSGRLSLGYQLETNDRASATVAPTRNRLSARYRYTMSSAWDADFGWSLRRSAYDDLAISRDEDLTELTVGFSRDFAAGFRLNGMYRWYDNSSDDGAFEYTRNRVSLGLTKNF